MNVEPIDLGNELWQGIQSCLAPPPVIIGRPIPRERLNEGELHALRRIGDGFLLRESRRRDAPAQFGEDRFRKIHLKWTNCILVICLLAVSWCSTSLGHGVLLFEYFEFLVCV